ncbi:strawberry notch C-terminal domain-containing protein [Chromobacterium haemolyticum]|uniref:strawberry notch C-terminal domain-containing protein n=1 Tax=Chromobacterium haemolyticum TaxID=394935 RepID=UPI002449A3FC|nr:strawberry notch C-terminal domain-containing protein [Chromobacterium haemolyticum]MDH0342032.1 strawberry notch C-terminal domain-containing protein [Chromobacterium haemolyticum]
MDSQAAQDGKALVNWIQLNAEDPDTRLVAVRFPSGTKRLVLVATGDVSGAQLQALTEMGFYRSRSGFLVRDDLRFTLPAIRRAFPKAMPVKVPMNQVTRIMPARAPVANDAPEAVGAVAVNNAVMTARPLGVNHLGQIVYQGEDGRFINDVKNNILREAEARAGATFLFASTPDDMALCAEGFVREIAGGKVFRFDDLKRFASVITQYPEKEIAQTPLLRQVQEAIEAALVRHMHRHVGTQIDRAAYNLAIRLEEGQPPFAARTSSSVTLQQFSTTLSISLVMQRILGPVEGKSVLEPTIGNASLVCGMSDALVFGCDLDASRIENVRRDRKDAVLQVGDATSFDFRELNGGNAFDLVVSNPPFGGLQASRMMQGLKITRIDHLILMRSLLARKDNGLAVYLIGADSYLNAKAGQVTGGSRYLFNWLADHYQVDVVEVDGGLYAKQGASFPIRIVVVGPKGTGNEQVPDVLPVLHDHDALFEWSGQMQAKYQAAAALELPRLSGGTPSDNPAPPASTGPRIRSLSRRRPEAEPLAPFPGIPEIPAALPEEESPDSEQREVAAPAVVVPKRPSPTEANVSDQEENSYQSPYPAYSRVGEASAMIPRNLATPTRMALSEVVSEFGDVDGFVAGELGWTVDEMAGYLSPEQVDAVALAINALQKGRGFLEADQTGLGKGRVMAALARYSALNSKPVIFLTETPTLFTDFWRDVRDIGSDDLFTPLIVNDGVSVYDPISGSKLIPATPKTVMDRALKVGEIDPAYNLILGTYSQFNRDRSTSAKARWISEMAKGRALLLDEAHNAAGESNTGHNIGLAIDVADYVVYSSATAMKAGKNVMLYSELFPNTVDMGSLPETLATGGEVLQEVLSGMLARDGVFVRREHDLSNLTFRTITDSAREERNRELSDKLAEILEYMNYIAGDINQLVNERNKEIKKLLESIPEQERKGNRMGAINVNFGSRLFAIYRQFMMALKTDLAAERAIQALEDGKKPVIVLENTMESLLSEVVLRNRPDILDADDMADGTNIAAMLQGDVFLEEGLTFRDVLSRMLNRLTYYCETTRYGEVTKVPITSAEAMETIALIDGLIADFPDLPVSPLDDIRQRIAAAGFVCDELSGRKTQIVERDGRLVATTMAERPKPQIVKDFVTGSTDGLLLTRAGSTGISLHASEKFPDQRQRVMIELQSAADVNVRVQFFGRVNRKGQTSSPEIETLSSGLIGEARPIAMQNAKLRKLSANTTANQDNAALDRTVPDFINAIGDEVAYRFLEANPSIARRLDIDMDNTDEDREESYFINKLTSRLIMLRVSEQEQIYAALTNEYLRVIKELDAKGTNPLKSRELDVKAREVGREIFESGNPHSDSAFSQPVYVKAVEYEVKVNPIRAAEVKDRVRLGADAVARYDINHESRENQDFFLALKAYLAGNRNRFLETVKGKDYVSVDEALSAKKVNAVQKMLQRLRVLDSVLDGLYVGAVARFTNDDDETDFGIITQVSVPDNPKHIHLLGAYELTFAVPGKQRPIERTLYSLQDDNQFRIMPKGGMERELYTKFDMAQAGTITHRRLILDGNLFKAAQIAATSSLGSSVIYTDAQGSRHRGVLLARGVEMQHLKSLPVRIESPEMCVAVLKHFNDISLSSSPDVSVERDRDLIIQAAGAEAVIDVPGTKARGGRFFGNEELVKWTGPFAGSRAVMTAHFPIENLKKVVDILYRSGVSLFAESSYREAINALNNVVYTNESCDEKDNESRMAKAC